MYAQHMHNKMLLFDRNPVLDSVKLRKKSPTYGYKACQKDWWMLFIVVYHIIAYFLFYSFFINSF